MVKKQIILLGGGGHCKSCIDVIEQNGEYEIIGILDSDDKKGSRILDNKVIGTDDNIPEFKKITKYFFIAVGQIETPETRIRLYNLLKKNKVQLPTIVSPMAYVSPHAILGHGTIIMHNACINAGAKIGENCIINSRALIEHDVTIGNHCHISTGAIINGGSQVGDGTFIGSGAIGIHGANIPANSFIRAKSLFK